MAVNRLNVGATNQLLAKASSGQSTNILELQNTAGVTVAGVDASGNPVGTLAHPPTFKNLIINGAMQIAQRATSKTSITSGDYYTADRWVSTVNSIGTWTQSVENDAPTGSGFRKSLKWLCTTADASPAASDVMLTIQRIEGQNLQQILKGTSSAKQLTLSFWVKSNVTGTYIVELEDADNTRNVSASYSVSASATWEKKTITFPADTTGVLDNDNNGSLAVFFWLGAGSNYTGGSPLQTSWGTATNTRATGQTNLASATNNYWQITGVQLEVGSVATDYEFKPIDVELAQCQRYYYRISGANGNYENIGTGVMGTTTGVSIFIPLKVTLRTLASSIEYSGLRIVAYNSSGVPVIPTISSIALTNTNTQMVAVSVTITGGTNGLAAWMDTGASTSNYFGVSAEL